MFLTGNQEKNITTILDRKQRLTSESKQKSHPTRNLGPLALGGFGGDEILREVQLTRFAPFNRNAYKSQLYC